MVDHVGLLWTVPRAIREVPHDPILLGPPMAVPTRSLARRIGANRLLLLLLRSVLRNVQVVEPRDELVHLLVIQNKLCSGNRLGLAGARAVVVENVETGVPEAELAMHRPSHKRSHVARTRMRTKVLMHERQVAKETLHHSFHQLVVRPNHVVELVDVLEQVANLDPGQHLGKQVGDVLYC
jgi:hypothetical protein